MEINIYRQIGTPWGLMGTILIEGKIEYRTLEHPTRHLPAGVYKVEIKYNKNYRKKWMVPPICKDLIYVPVIRNIGARPIKTASRIPFFMPGNGVFTLKHGSIIIGMPGPAGLLLHSFYCYRDFYGVLERAIEEGEDIVLIIQDIGKKGIPLSSVYVF